MRPQPLPPIRPPLLHDIIGGLSRLPTRIVWWRDRRRVSPLWTVVVAAVFAVVALPLVTIAGLAVTPAENIWPHLMRYVLPGSLATTLGLMLGVGVVTAIVGTATAWIITMYRFPGRAVLDRLLVVPLAMPTYVVAYCYVDLLDYSGPAQRAVRALGGWTSARDYWFPDVQTLSGAIFVMSGVLYPYVYLAARASFVQQSVCALEVARTLGQTAMGAFRTVALPLARPAVAAGVALVLMETLNDLGAVQHLGVETLTQSIYTTWLKRSNLGGAAQIAVVMLLFVVALFGLEYLARGEARFHHTTGRYRSIPFADLAGWRAGGAIALCLAPFLFGFVVPALVLVTNAVTHYAPATAAGFWRAAGNSVLLSLLAAAMATGLALVVAYARRIAANGFTRPAVAAIGLGYAVPGTVLALGLMIPLAAFDNRVDALMRSWFGVSTGLVLSGTLLVLVLAYVVRFLAVALGSIEAGMLRISPNLDAAARTLGETALSALWRVHLPLLLPPLGAAGLLVFVDCMKELPATVLLRPFNFETLATHVYAYASLEQFETASVGALAIVLAGLVPVLLLHRAVAGGRAGGTSA
jgi:iron(III) transport system permease protein